MSLGLRNQWQKVTTVTLLFIAQGFDRRKQSVCDRNIKSTGQELQKSSSDKDLFLQGRGVFFVAYSESEPKCPCRILGDSHYSDDKRQG